MAGLDPAIFAAAVQVQMAGAWPAIHVYLATGVMKSWMAGTRHVLGRAMTGKSGRCPGILSADAKTPNQPCFSEPMPSDASRTGGVISAAAGAA
jgi:hypothetical protein